MLWLSYLGINSTIQCLLNVTYYLCMLYELRTIERYFQCALRGIHMEAATEWNVDDVDDS